ncbi:MULTISPECIES: DUF2281 domain-containing protein [unclassified Arcicella]|uniref:DUF2281 domain-containing protein n=1 Tax=unclassified Arcicella TaxID=2644986 RepID=UPI0028548D2F|nr:MULTISPECIES: DUF2281 domain-containing protein [unclassified Arcicella]MDR6563945.1 antitoxin component of MazEF toxin-antitoxin module [Arcicella sp. BE51]MDR6813698.1 antitoxin component of MazEF toxin-antitoxin module [Arcicella sp. BE140]MDR6824921.1 antitoxin component of MazEF toxin-antitoxin module [Arcicella sp. BE139]
MLQAIEFPTVLTDNQHIDIPSNLCSQLKANQSVRVIVLVTNDVEETPKKKRQLGILAGKISIPDDFDEPLEDLNEYMY